MINSNTPEFKVKKDSMINSSYTGFRGWNAIPASY